MAGVTSTQSYVNPYQWSKQMGGGRGKSKSKSKSKKKKTYTKAQQMAKKRIAAGKTISSVKSANKKSMQQKAAERNKSFQAAKAAKKSAPKSIAKGTTGIGPVSSGKTYAKAVNTAKNQPKKKTSGIGPYADGAKYAAALKASPPKFNEGTKVAQVKFKSVPAGGPAGDNMSTKEFREGMLPGLRDVVPGESLQNTLKRITNTDGLAATGDLTGLGISPTTSTNYFKIKSPDTFGAPSQEAVDAAAGITAGGLNIGGGGFTPDKPSGSTSRAIRDMTSEQLADRYEASLNPDSFKGLSDGATFGVGPVASGDAYARGLNTDNKNVENR